MSDDRSLHIKRQLLDEIWEEIGSLKGKDSTNISSALA